MSKENRKMEKATLQALREAALKACPNLSERDLNAVVANGITDPKKLAGMTPYHQMVGTQVVYGVGDAYHDADGVVETTRRGR